MYAIFAPDAFPLIEPMDNPYEQDNQKTNTPYFVFEEDFPPIEPMDDKPELEENKPLYNLPDRFLPIEPMDDVDLENK